MTGWKTKVPARMLAGYKLDLQRMFNTKLPTALLNFGFKLRVKNVSRSLRMRFCTASFFGLALKVEVSFSSCVYVLWICVCNVVI